MAALSPAESVKAVQSQYKAAVSVTFTQTEVLDFAFAA